MKSYYSNIFILYLNKSKINSRKTYFLSLNKCKKKKKSKYNCRKDNGDGIDGILIKICIQ